MNDDSYNLETLLRTAIHMRMSCVKKEFEKRNLNPASHAPILFILRHEAENMVASQREIASKLGISAPTVAVSINRMEKAGLVQKVADQTDLRRNLITLTQKGLLLVEESLAVFETVDEGMLKGFQQLEQEQFKMFFLRIITNLEVMGAQPPDDLKIESRQMDKESKK
jgi:DNA-binding MarR family transcriptional regulator